jgi:hypothetical protein
MHFQGNQYSLLLLLFYIPNGLAGAPISLGEIKRKMRNG